MAYFCKPNGASAFIIQCHLFWSAGFRGSTLLDLYGSMEAESMAKNSISMTIAPRTLNLCLYSIARYPTLVAHTKSTIDSYRLENGAWPDSPALVMRTMVVERSVT